MTDTTLCSPTRHLDLGHHSAEVKARHGPGSWFLALIPIVVHSIYSLCGIAECLLATGLVQYRLL